MTTPPRTSVTGAAKNEVDSLSNCVGSVLLPVEIVIVGDCITDETQIKEASKRKVTGYLAWMWTK